jgi:hypothetical protein
MSATLCRPCETIEWKSPTRQRLELQADQDRADMAYLEVTMRLFDPNFEPEISTDTRTRNDWFRPGE